MVPCCGKLIFANLSVASALPCQFETVLGPSFNTANVFWVSAIETPYHYGFFNYQNTDQKLPMESKACLCLHLVVCKIDANGNFYLCLLYTDIIFSHSSHCFWAIVLCSSEISRNKEISISNSFKYHSQDIQFYTDFFYLKVSLNVLMQM